MKNLVAVTSLLLMCVGGEVLARDVIHTTAHRCGSAAVKEALDKNMTYKVRVREYRWNRVNGEYQAAAGGSPSKYSYEQLTLYGVCVPSPTSTSSSCTPSKVVVLNHKDTRNNDNCNPGEVDIGDRAMNMHFTRNVIVDIKRGVSDMTAGNKCVYALVNWEGATPPNPATDHWRGQIQIVDKQNNVPC